MKIVRFEAPQHVMGLVCRCPCSDASSRFVCMTHAGDERETEGGARGTTKTAESGGGENARETARRNPTQKGNGV